MTTKKPKYTKYSQITNDILNAEPVPMPSKSVSESESNEAKQELFALLNYGRRNA